MCFQITAISDDKLYVEEVDINSCLRVNSYNILKNGEYENSYLKFEMEKLSILFEFLEGETLWKKLYYGDVVMLAEKHMKNFLIVMK